MAARRSIHFLIPIAVLFVLVRLVYLRQLESSPLLELLTLDAAYYHQWAMRLMQGLGHSPGPFFLSPLYPLFLSGIYLGLGANPAAAVAVQIFLSTGTLIVLFLAVRIFFDDTVAVFTSLLALLYAPWLYFDGMLLTSSLILFLNALLLFFLAHLLYSKTSHGWLWLAAGIVAGLSALARPSVLLFVLLLIIWFGLRRGKNVLASGKLRWRAVAVLILGVLVPLVPVLVRNMTVGGSSFLTTSSAGINFYIGNRVGAFGALEELPWLEASDPQTEAKRYREEASRRAGRSLTLEQASRYWMGEGLRDIVRHPGAWLQTQARKLWLTAQGGEIRTNLGFASVKSFCPTVRLMPLTWGLLFPLAAAGFFLYRRRKRETTLLMLYLAAYLIINLIFFAASEYRYPMILVFLPFAAQFFVGIFRELRERQFKKILWAIAIYIVALVVVNFPSQLRAELTNPSIDFFNLGSEAVNRGQIEKSIPLFTRALAAQPDYRHAHLELARSLWQVGNYDDARREFEEANMAPPDTLHGEPLSRILHEIGMLFEEGEYDEALYYIDSLFRSEAATPMEVLALRGETFEKLHRFKEAAQVYLRIASRASENPEWPYRAALAMRSTGDTAACDSLLETALNIYPAYAPARVELASNALARGDTAAARTQLTELRRIRVPVDSIRQKIGKLERVIDEPAGASP